MKIEELKRKMQLYSEVFGPVPGCINMNGIINIFTDSTVQFYRYWFGSEEFVVFDIGEKRKYYLWLTYDENENDEIAVIDEISVMTAQVYVEIKDRINNKKKEINNFLLNIFDQEFDNQWELMSMFKPQKKLNSFF